MNYIKELNAFSVKQETNRLSLGAANLWHVLMAINNRAGWVKEFTVAMSLLCYKAVLSESTCKRARTELQEKGYIRYQSRGGNQAAVYSMISLCDFEGVEEAGGVAGKASGNVDGKAGGKVSGKVNDSASGNPSTLYKQKEKKIKGNRKEHAGTDAEIYFQRNFTEKIPETLHRWVQEVGEDLVLHAMNLAVEREKAEWRYVEGILRSWKKKGILTVEDAERERAQLQSGKKYYYAENRQRSSEIVPWWMDKHREESRKRSEEERRRMEEQDPNVVRERIERYKREMESDVGS
ncbi:DnaD domain-containing protein [Oceanobacillus halophilus]|nr:DnaD domain protein [Oceanobacillus halophilus]